MPEAPASMPQPLFAVPRRERISQGDTESLDPQIAPHHPSGPCSSRTHEATRRTQSSPGCT